MPSHHRPALLLTIKTSDSSQKLKALLIDLNGTLHIGSESTPSAGKAIERLRSLRIPFIFCSNSTKESSASLLDKLKKIGFDVKKEELMTSLSAGRMVVEEKGLKLVRPFQLSLSVIRI